MTKTIRVAVQWIEIGTNRHALQVGPAYYFLGTIHKEERRLWTWESKGKNGTATTMKKAQAMVQISLRTQAKINWHD